MLSLNFNGRSIFKIQQKAARIISNSKYNALNEAFVKYLSIPKANSGHTQNFYYKHTLATSTVHPTISSHTKIYAATKRGQVRNYINKTQTCRKHGWNPTSYFYWIAYPLKLQKRLTHTVWNRNMPALHWVIPKCKLLPFCHTLETMYGCGIFSRVIYSADRNIWQISLKFHLGVKNIVYISSILLSAYLNIYEYVWMNTLLIFSWTFF